MNRWEGLLAIFFLGAGLALSGEAFCIDLHRVWDDRCAPCHGHAAEFARRTLVVVDGQLLGRHPQRDLEQFLEHHYLVGHEIGPFHAMLLAQASTVEARFQAQCARCHQSAAALARTGLVWHRETLHGRKSGLPVALFLPGHVPLAAGEVVIFERLLSRVIEEVRPRGTP